MQSKYVRVSLLISAAAALTACGGGGSGGNDPVKLQAFVSGTSDTSLTVGTGANFSFTVTASSPDRAMTSLAWTMQASPSAPALQVNNLDCATTEKQDTPQQNSLVSSLWRCTISGTAPKQLAQDAVYTFTANGKNSQSSTDSATTTLKVTAPTGDGTVPKVTVDGATSMNAGDSSDFSCTAKGGYMPTGQNYTLEWTSSSVDSAKFTISDRLAAKMKATAPAVKTKTSLILSCGATDAAGVSGIGSIAVDVLPLTPTATITGADTGTAGQSIGLTCAGSGGYTAGGAAYTFSWTTAPVGSYSLSFDNAQRDVVSVTLPDVQTISTFIATCQVKDAGGNSGTASKAITVNPVPKAPATPASGA